MPSSSKMVKKMLRDGEGADPRKLPCKKAKLLRLDRKKEKMLRKGQEFKLAGNPDSMRKTLEQLLGEIPSTAKHKLNLKLIPTSICGDEWEQTKHVEFELYKKYQIVVHNDVPDDLNMRSFSRFLVTSPLKPKPFPNKVKGPGYGSFHQQYWIDDKLIAVGVVDILPGCVSSVYFFYDPDYRDLTLGTYGSLREIQLTKHLQTKVPDLRHYYLGFYIHSCPKMRYKGRLNPSWLLCPETYLWQPVRECLAKLDTSKYSRLEGNVDAIDTNNCCPRDVSSIKVLYGCKLMFVRDFLRHCKTTDKSMFDNLANLVGKKAALSIMFWLD